jgi:hypothetical protein
VRVVGAGCETASCRRLIEADAAVLGLPFVAGADCTDADADGTADVCLPPGDPDLDGDGFVDATDLAELLAGWGLADRHRDLDRSGTVGAGDLSILLAAWR